MLSISDGKWCFSEVSYWFYSLFRQKPNQCCWVSPNSFGQVVMVSMTMHANPLPLFDFLKSQNENGSRNLQIPPIQVKEDRQGWDPKQVHWEDQITILYEKNNNFSNFSVCNFQRIVIQVKNPENDKNFSMNSNFVIMELINRTSCVRILDG